METMQPGEPTAPEPVRVPRPRHRIFLTLLVTMAVLAAGVAVYVLTRPPPIPLLISDGSIDRILTSTFQDYFSNNPVYRVYQATTLASTADGKPANLTMRLYLAAFMDGTTIVLDLFPGVTGTFDPSLAPSTLTLTFNQTGRLAWGSGYAASAAFNNSFAWAPIAYPGPSNVTDTHALLPQVAGNGSTSMSTGLANTTTSGPRYEFFYPAYIDEEAPVTSNLVFGVRATVTGPFAPAVSVGIVVHLVDIPVPSAGFAMSIGKTPWNDWTMDVTSLGGNFTDGSVDLRITSLGGSTVVPATPLGGLPASPYNTSLAYVAVAPGSGYLSVGDVIILSAARYTHDYLVDILWVHGSLETDLYLATLG